jgi:hypothetical protein
LYYIFYIMSNIESDYLKSTNLKKLVLFNFYNFIIVTDQFQVFQTELDWLDHEL